MNTIKTYELTVSHGKRSVTFQVLEPGKLLDNVELAGHYLQNAVQILLKKL